MSNGISSGVKINWGLVIQFATMVFLAGIAYASFETKEHAAQTAAELKRFNAETYMPRELSLEKWKNNDLSHEEMKKMLEEILREARNANKLQAAKTK